MTGPSRTSGAFAAMSIASFLTCSACMVGPDFVRPRAPEATRYDETQDPLRMSAGSNGTQTLVPGAELPADWWNIFRSAQLDRLVRLGLANNPTVAQAEASLRQAKASTDAARAALYPVVTTGLSRNGGGSVGTEGSIYGTYGANFGVGYTPDFFGGTRRGIEAATASEEATGYALRAAELALAGNIIAAAFQEAALSQQIVESRQVLQRDRERLELVRVRQAAGAEPIASFLTQQSVIQSQIAGIASLNSARAQVRHRLAILTGLPPTAYEVPGLVLTSLPLPHRLPLRLPSRLVERRPDIRAAEAQLHAASAAVGVATANLFPQINLSASLGAGAVSLAALAASTAWSTAAGVSQTVFDGGALNANRRISIEAYKIALDTYQSTVFSALQNVADALTVLAADAKTLEANSKAEDLARRSLRAAEVEYEAGSLSYETLLSAQTQFSSATLARSQSQAQRLIDTAALLQALGGGWDE